MSTEYTIHTKGGVDLELWEHSAVLDLATVAGEHSTVVLPDMTPAEVVATALQMLKVAEYQIGREGFMAAVRSAIQAEPYSLRNLCTDVGTVARQGVKP